MYEDYVYYNGGMKSLWKQQSQIWLSIRFYIYPCAFFGVPFSLEEKLVGLISVSFPHNDFKNPFIFIIFQTKDFGNSLVFLVWLEWLWILCWNRESGVWVTWVSVFCTSNVSTKEVPSSQMHIHIYTYSTSVAILISTVVPI